MITFPQKILRKAKVENNKVYLPKVQLSRDQYNKVNEVLTRLWGKWNAKSKAHLFTYDPSEALTEYCQTGVLPPKNETAFFPTPKVILDDIIKVITTYNHLGVDMSFADFSAGQGAIVDSVLNNSELSDTIKKYVLVELLDLNHGILERKYKGKKNINVIQGDFLKKKFKRFYDLVIINPPFSVPGQPNCYMDHIYKAHELLSPKGILCCVVPTNWVSSDKKALIEFRDFVSEYNLHIWKYPKGAFKDSGTMIETMVVCLESEEQRAANKSHRIQTTYFEFYYAGNYGYEYSRQKNINLSVEEYVDKILKHSWDESNCYDGLSTQYRNKFIKITTRSDSLMDKATAF